MQRPGELGENSGDSSFKDCRVEVYDQFILITFPDGPTILSPHGWYTDLAFRHNPQAQSDGQGGWAPLATRNPP